MSKNNWYSAESWYAPLQPEQPQAKAEKRGGKRPKLSFRWRLGIGLTLVLGLIVLSSVLFSRPEPVPGPAENFIGDDMPADWQDFFAGYYTETEGAPQTTQVEKVSSMPDFELELVSPGDKELSLQELYEKCSKSIVSIRAYVDGADGYFLGTGVIISADGLVITNAHIITDCDSVSVILHDDSEYEAKLVGFDSVGDLTILKMDAKGMPAAEFGDSSQLRVGDRVAAIGNPLGESFRMTLTDGIVSGIGRNMDYNGRSMSLIQTNTALNKGNSGGALFNMYGQVVGITNMKMSSAYSSIEGIAFAIPSTTVKATVDSLIKHGVVLGRPALGITVGAIPQELAEHYDIPNGLYVSDVSEGSDAQAKGVKAGDILIALNGEEILSSEDILTVRNRLQIGDTMTFTIWRDGETFDVDVVLMDSNDMY